GTLASQAALVFGFAAVHTVAVALGFARDSARLAEALAGPRTWLIPAALLAALGALAGLGAAGGPLPPPFDDHGQGCAPVQRLLDTGGLGDSIGYAGRWQLGAQVALAAVASGAGDDFARAAEALAFVLALGLATSRIGVRDAGSAPWAAALIVASSALALA